MSGECKYEINAGRYRDREKTKVRKHDYPSPLRIVNEADMTIARYKKSSESARTVRTF